MLPILTSFFHAGPILSICECGNAHKDEGVPLLFPAGGWRPVLPPRCGSVQDQILGCVTARESSELWSFVAAADATLRFARYLRMNGPDHFILFRDETGGWGAAPPGFRDLVLDTAGFGETAWAAIDDLLGQPEFQEGVILGRWPMPVASDFIEVPEPDGAKMAEFTDIYISSNVKAAIRRRSFRVISGSATRSL